MSTRCTSMKLTKCPNDHYYNADKFPYCPHCINAQGIVSEDYSSDQKKIPTEKIAPLSPYEETFYEKLTVGWLVCLMGSNRGQSYPIFNTTNHIGRNSNMDIIIKNEKTISREDHAVIEYHTDDNTFSISTGNSTNPTLINDTVILNKSDVKNRDIIQLGECRLMLIILCDGSFSW